jgi:hypothetical protein
VWARAARISVKGRRAMKYATERPFADPEKAARKLMEIASTVGPVQESTSRRSTDHSSSATAAVRLNMARASRRPSRGAGYGGMKAGPM